MPSREVAVAARADFLLPTPPTPPSAGDTPPHHYPWYQKCLAHLYPPMALSPGLTIFFTQFSVFLRYDLYTMNSPILSVQFEF